MRVSLRLLLLTSLVGLSVGSSLELQATRFSDPMGAYCILDRVVLEPADSPTTAQLWGACASANDNDWYFQPAARGYFYYRIPEGVGAAQTARNEWADLKSVAGTGEAVGFGRRYRPVGRFRNAEEKPSAPDPYPLHIGVVKMGSRNAVPEVREIVVRLKTLARAR